MQYDGLMDWFAGVVRDGSLALEEVSRKVEERLDELEEEDEFVEAEPATG